MEGLDKCPFCGGDAFCTDWYEGRGYGIKCKGCGKIWGPFTKPEDSYRLWNTRAEKVVKVKRGNYEDYMTYDNDGECECGKIVDAIWDFCPNCGARLDWNKDEYQK